MSDELLEAIKALADWEKVTYDHLAQSDEDIAFSLGKLEAFRAIIKLMEAKPTCQH